MATDKQIAFWERKVKHREGKTPLYKTWAMMKQRCYNPNAHGYSEYGGRGIHVCNEWVNDYLRFRDWALENGYEKGLSIDRIDNNKGYSPDNCRWATRKEQQRNKRCNRYATLNGETKLLAEFSDEYGISLTTLHARVIKLGWPIERAVTEPIHKGGKRL